MFDIACMMLNCSCSSVFLHWNFGEKNGRNKALRLHTALADSAVHPVHSQTWIYESTRSLAQCRVIMLCSHLPLPGWPWSCPHLSAPGLGVISLLQPFLLLLSPLGGCVSILQSALLSLSASLCCILHLAYPNTSPHLACVLALPVLCPRFIFQLTTLPPLAFPLVKLKTAKLWSPLPLILLKCHRRLWARRLFASGSLGNNGVWQQS